MSAFQTAGHAFQNAFAFQGAGGAVPDTFGTPSEPRIGPRSLSIADGRLGRDSIAGNGPRIGAGTVGGSPRRIGK